MTELTGMKEMTFNVAASDEYEIVYNFDYVRADIYNGTSGVIYVNSTGGITEGSEEDIGEYLSIPAGGAYNKYSPAPASGVSRLYIYAEAAGTISICATRA